ncbi:28S ribosomal protein S17, mitochondrial [Daphnia magna]|uniref:28S ribosomal protein S17, mitochondrial n=1 Tax=Daphnia magna TaxID=35525 RepID=A0A0P5R8J1_9CRUS|nr:28S ribosomal protein S17, mitochondrial [Daphnia magna]KZS22025.1 Mitochondrial ribosomal protein S17 [Daphnia magna]CAG4639621.1 EOG090X0GMQ [Daphnia magna]
MAAVQISKLASVLARCLPSDVKNAAKFKVKLVEFDQNLNMHFAKHVTVYANDPTNACKPGDVVLIDKLPKKLTKHITHQVYKIVYSFGDITDPITGKKVVVGKYRDEIEAKNVLFGKNPSGFDYDRAQDRGWQAGKRDFSDKETYKKFHMFDHDEPYAV